jgi:hypothetical protein
LSDEFGVEPDEESQSKQINYGREESHTLAEETIEAS